MARSDGGRHRGGPSAAFPFSPTGCLALRPGILMKTAPLSGFICDHDSMDRRKMSMVNLHKIAKSPLRNAGKCAIVLIIGQ